MKKSLNTISMAAIYALAMLACNGKESVRFCYNGAQLSKAGGGLDSDIEAVAIQAVDLSRSSVHLKKTSQII